ncbi:MAG: peptidylprolyl isomerase [Planctomycetota bacterium]|nr:peptidylprolyl isomerase [Planctomycetota bacterium]
MQLSVANRTSPIAFAIFAAAVTLYGVLPTSGYGQAPSREAGGERPLVVMATVDGAPIYQGEVDQELAVLLRNKKLAADDRARAEAHFLNQLIDRRLLLRYLKRRDQTISPQLVDSEIKARTARLEQQKVSLEDRLQALGFTKQALRTDIEWRMSWKRYIDRRITDDVLQQHFDKNRRQFDGTQMRVRHILLRGKTSADNGADTTHVTLAQQIRRDILEGKTTFPQAVTEHSTGPSKKDGGDLGFISRQGQMVERFAAAAFELDKDEISPPVVTRFGVHLIQCVEIKPGTKKWADVADQLRSAVIQRGFQKIAAAERPRAKIEFTGKGAYLDPHSGELVRPDTKPSEEDRARN